MTMEQRYARLQIQSSSTAETIARVRKEIEATASLPEIRLDASELLATVDAIVQRTGDLDFARNNLLTFAQATQGYGGPGSGGAIGQIGSELRKLGIKTEKEVAEFFNLLAAQGTQGAFTLGNVATEGPRLFSAYSRLGYKGPDAGREMGALAQLSQMGTGSAPEATTAFEALLRTFTDAEKGEAIWREFGVNVRNASGAFRPPSEIIKDVFAATGGDPTEMSRVFDETAIRALPSTAEMLAKYERILTMQAPPGALAQAAAVMAETAGSKVQEAKGDIDAWMQDKLTGPVGEVVTALTSFKDELLVGVGLLAGSWYAFKALRGAGRLVARLAGRGSGPGTRPRVGEGRLGGSGPGSRPSLGGGRLSGSGPGTRPRVGEGRLGGSGPGSRPSLGGGRLSGSGPGTRPRVGEGRLGGSGPGSRPSLGGGRLSGSGPGTRPRVGEGRLGGSGPGSSPSLGGGRLSGIGPGTRPRVGEGRLGGTGPGSRPSLGGGRLSGSGPGTRPRVGEGRLGGTGPGSRPSLGGGRLRRQRPRHQATRRRRPARRLRPRLAPQSRRRTPQRQRPRHQATRRRRPARRLRPRLAPQSRRRTPQRQRPRHQATRRRRPARRLRPRLAPQSRRRTPQRQRPRHQATRRRRPARRLRPRLAPQSRRRTPQRQRPRHQATRRRRPARRNSGPGTRPRVGEGRLSGGGPSMRPRNAGGLWRLLSRSLGPASAGALMGLTAHDIATGAIPDDQVAPEVGGLAGGLGRLLSGR